MKSILYILGLVDLITLNAQTNFTSDPKKALVITSDLELFWNAFNKMDDPINPFESYIENGSIGLHEFIPHRIINADSLYSKVQLRKEDYLKAKGIHFDQKELIPYYESFKELYPYVKFPPVYFVMGRFNSGGTSGKHGLIIGTEMLPEIDISIPSLIIHEGVHFQQNVLDRPYTLAEQAFIEGSADFIAELITKEPANPSLHNYCNQRRDSLLSEFAKSANSHQYTPWMYTEATNGLPRDIGYWVGYEISKALYDQAEDKNIMINRLLNNNNYEVLIKQSGVFEPYLSPIVVGLSPFDNEDDFVGPTLTELTIHFSNKMTGSSFQPIREEGVEFPLVDVIGYNDNATSFTLRIDLKPNTEYGFKVTGKGFKNAYGYSLKDFIVRFKTQSE